MPKKRTFLPYTKARAFARSLRLKNRTEWRAYAKTHKEQLEAQCVPASPELHYASPKDRCTTGSGYTDPRYAAPAFYRVLADPSAHLLGMKDADLRALAHELADTLQQYLAGNDVWEPEATVWAHLRSLVKSALSHRGSSSNTAVSVTAQILQKQADTLATAHIGAWVNWHDWLGSSYTPRLTTSFLSSAEFVAFLKQKRITTQAQYQRWRKNAANRRTPLYSRLPGSPAIYTYFSWKKVSPTTRPTGGGKPRNTGGAVAQDYAPFGDVRRKVRALKLVKKEHWVAFVKDNPDWLREHRCPRHPDSVTQYRPRWHGWQDFLGSDTLAKQRYKLA